MVAIGHPVRWLCLLLASAIAGLGARSPDEAPSYDAIVVLGCRVNRGGEPSDALRRRAEHAARLFHQGKARRVITTGGIGDHGPSEASVAAAVLRDNGVPAEVISEEESSTSTWENALFSRQQLGDGRVLVVSDDYHTARAEQVFRCHFASAHAVGSASPYRETRFWGALRETNALIIYAALGRLYLGPSLAGSPSTGSVEPGIGGPRVRWQPPVFRLDALPAGRDETDLALRATLALRKQRARGRKRVQPRLSGCRPRTSAPPARVRRRAARALPRCQDR